MTGADGQLRDERSLRTVLSSHMGYQHYADHRRLQEWIRNRRPFPCPYDNCTATFSAEMDFSRHQHQIHGSQQEILRERIRPSWIPDSAYDARRAYWEQLLQEVEDHADEPGLEFIPMKGFVDPGPGRWN
jgi:hypothetical protein